MLLRFGAKLDPSAGRTACTRKACNGLSSKFFLLAATALADQKRTSACGGNPRAGGGGRPLWGRVVGSARLTSPEPSGQRWLGAVGHLMTITAQGWRAMAERSGAGF